MYGRGYRSPGMGFGPPVTPPIVKKILIANLVVFVAELLTGGGIAGRSPLIGIGSVVPLAVWQGGYIWQPFTYMWLHANFVHIAFNMFALWMFGSQLALVWGAKRFLRYYLVCGFGAGLLIATYPFLLMGVAPEQLVIPTLGASGAVYGVLLAFSLTWPDRTIALIFPPVAFRAIWLIPLLFLMNWMMGGNVSHVGHLGGVLVGWIYLRRDGEARGLFSLRQLRYRWKRYRMRQKLRAVRYEEQRERRRYDDDRTLH